MPTFVRGNRSTLTSKKKQTSVANADTRMKERLRRALSEISELKLWNAYWSRENKKLKQDVECLIAWKARALDQLTSFAPLRDRAKKELNKAEAWKHQLKRLEQHIGRRAALESNVCSAQDREKQLKSVVEEQALQLKHYDSMRASLTDQYTDSQIQLHALQDIFREHLKQLLESMEAMNKTDTADATEISSIKSDFTVNNDALAETFAAVSKQCVLLFNDFQRRIDKTFQTKNIDTLHLTETLCQMRKSLDTAKSDVKDYKVRCEIAEEEAKAGRIKIRAIEAELAVLDERVHAGVLAHADMTARLRAFMKQVNDYCKLVRCEIRKKFGYLPESITHVDEWDRILSSLHCLERSHCHFATRSCIAH